MQKIYWILIGIIVSIVLAISVVEAVNYFENQRVHCSVDPYDVNCFCYDTEVRGVKTEEDGRLRYICFPSEPSGYYTLPIETWDEAFRFVEYNFGTSRCTCGLKAECEQVDMLLEDPVSPGTPFSRSGNIPEEWMTGPLELRCMHIKEYDSAGRPKSLTRVWGIRFMPNSGNIYERVCNPEYMLNCPDNIRPLSIMYYIFYRR